MKKILTLILLLLFSVILQTAFAQSNEQPSSPFEVLLFTNKLEIEYGEPLIFTLTFQNKDTKKHTFSSVLNLAGDFEITVSRMYKLPERYLGSSKPAIYPNNVFEEMRPFEKKKVLYMLFYSSSSPKGLLFDMPGEYTIMVNLKYQADLKDTYQLKFPPIIINVKATENEAESGINTITNKETWLNIQKMLIPQANIEEMKKFMDKYPKSPIIPYIEYSLARTIAISEKPNETFPPAIEAFNAFINKYPDFFFNDNLVYTIASYYNALGKKDDVYKTLVRLYNNYPESPMISEKNGLFKDFVFKNVRKFSDIDWMLYP